MIALLLALFSEIVRRLRPGGVRALKLTLIGVLLTVWLVFPIATKKRAHLHGRQKVAVYVAWGLFGISAVGIMSTNPQRAETPVQRETKQG